MLKKTLSNAIGSIQSSKSRTVPKEQASRPDPTTEQIPQDLKVTYPPGENVTQDEISTGGNKTSTDNNCTAGVPSTGGKNLTTDTNLFPDQKDEIKEADPEKARLTPEEKTALTLQKLRKGFTRIPNSILIEIVYGNLSKAEIKILLLIARYTLSFSERKTASLSKADIERYTRLQGKSILEALTTLVEKNLIIKIKGDQYSANQLGLIYGSEIFEPQKAKNSTESTDPDPSKNEDSTSEKNSTQDPKVTSPAGEKGTHPADTKSTYFKLSSSNDLSLSSEFPNDMIARWKIFETTGRSSNTNKEREIFKNLLKAHGKEFFDYCGRVVHFLETFGNGKPGDEGKVHCPMVWMNGHWETNFTRYRTWIAKEQAEKEAQAQKAEQERLNKQQRKEQEETQGKQRQEREENEAKNAEIELRLLRFYSSESEKNRFIEKAVELSGCEYTRSSWRNLGWDSPVVKNCVISHFLKTEANAELNSFSSQDSAAIA